ncbi:GATA transcription factor 26 [Acorus gramineus]|uniref:GATA transcription factor 26 n=1 Tax=Acorus gramineus TaxID=55184 RepID=A0AAV9AD74_ACOGR|nr:GATA transcription factor 26 [Acorus gramineus]
MGKHGPCYHCGVTSTPLWRNGPPDKPILCNACGSRWRTKGTLTNYTPLHARAEPFEAPTLKISKPKNMPVKKEPKLYKRKQWNVIEEGEGEGEARHCDQNFRKVLDEDTSNRSSSGSAISCSESCAHFGSAEASDWTGSSQSNVWDSLVPSRKRTCINRPKPSPVEKLTKDLCSILHEQQSSYISGSSEEDLLYESGTPMGSFEIGHGGILIKNPNSVGREEESEASSLPVENRLFKYKEPFSGPSFSHMQSESKGTSTSNFVSFETFVRHLTHEEQQRLMRFLPAEDTARLPESLQNMFDSPQFLENLSSFQQLLMKGIFDLSFSGASIEECRNSKKLALGSLTKSKWVEHHKVLKSEQKGTMRSPKRHHNCMTSNQTTAKSPPRTNSALKSIYNTDDYMDNDGSSFSPRRLFASPKDRMSFTDDNSEQDLLLDIPSNASFPEAELLCNIYKPKTAPNGLMGRSSVIDKEESHSKSSSDSSQQQQLG